MANERQIPAMAGCGPAQRVLGPAPAARAGSSSPQLREISVLSGAPMEALGDRSDVESC